VEGADHRLYVQLVCHVCTTVLITGDIVNGKTRIPEVQLTCMHNIVPALSLLHMFAIMFAM
jgi:hypothetical protein